jgi:hypothetical protein
MADHHHPISVEPEAIQRAEIGFTSFTQFTKYGILFVIGVLILMAITLL